MMGKIINLQSRKANDLAKNCRDQLSKINKPISGNRLSVMGLHPSQVKDHNEPSVESALLKDLAENDPARIPVEALLKIVGIARGHYRTTPDTNDANEALGKMWGIGLTALRKFEMEKEKQGWGR